jgi:hypothetical protein
MTIDQTRALTIDGLIKFLSEETGYRVSARTIWNECFS